MTPYQYQSAQPYYHQAPQPPMPPQPTQLAVGQHSFKNLEQMLSAAATGAGGIDDFQSQSMPVRRVYTAANAEFPELKCREDREFAQKIVDQLYALEPNNSKMECNGTLHNLTFYIWAEHSKTHVNRQVINLLHNIPYPKHGVGGVTLVASCPPETDPPYRPYRLVVGFVPQHVASEQTFQPQLAASQMLLEAPAVRITRHPSSSRASESDSRSGSPEQEAKPGFVKRLLGIAAEAPKETRRKEHQRRSRRK